MLLCERKWWQKNALQSFSLIADTWGHVPIDQPLGAQLQGWVLAAGQVWGWCNGAVTPWCSHAVPKTLQPRVCWVGEQGALGSAVIAPPEHSLVLSHCMTVSVCPSAHLGSCSMSSLRSSLGDAFVSLSPCSMQIQLKLYPTFCQLSNLPHRSEISLRGHICALCR